MRIYKTIIFGCLCFMACSPYIITLAPREIQAYQDKPEGKYRFTLLTKDGVTLDFYQFEIKEDTLIVMNSEQLHSSQLYSNQFIYDPDPQRIPFERIESIVTVNQHNRSNAIPFIVGSGLNVFIIYWIGKSLRGLGSS